MLGTQNIEKRNAKFEEAANNYNDKLLKAYERACEAYHAAGERYERLVEIYKDFKEEKDALDVERGKYKGDVSSSEKALRQMILDAQAEQYMIADKAREYIKYLSASKYAM